MIHPHRPGRFRALWSELPYDQLVPAAAKGIDPFDGAACRETDPDLFFSSVGEREAARRRRERDAVTICRACDVRPACLRHALATPEHYGVWGGMTEDERRRLDGAA